MAELKTKATAVNIDDFLASLADPRRREEVGTLDALYRQVTGEQPKMWGPSIIGYGSWVFAVATTAGARARCAVSAFRRARRNWCFMPWRPGRRPPKAKRSLHGWASTSGGHLYIESWRTWIQASSRR